MTLTFFWIMSTGIVGNNFQLHDYIVRNALFATLVRCDWPLTLPDGSYYVYYLASWLPPALAARIHPIGSFPFYCLGAWCYAGVLLMCFLMDKKLGRLSPLFLLLLMFTGYAGDWFAGSDMLPYVHPFMCFFSMGSSAQLQSTFHHVIPVWIVLALYFSGALSWRHAVCASALVLLVSPLGSIGLAVFFLFILVWERKKAAENLVALVREPAFFCGCLLAVIAAAYFLSSNEGSSFQWVWEKLRNYSSSQIGQAMFYAWGWNIGLILVLAIVMKQSQNYLIWFVLGMLALLPLFYVGTSNNELSFKAACVPYWILALLLTQWMDQSNRKKKLCILVFVLLSAGGMIRMLSICYLGFQRPDANKLQLEWQWHLYHPEHEWYSRFKGTMKTSRLYYTEAGASSRTFLSWSPRDTRSDRELLPPPSPWIGREMPSPQPAPSGNTQEK